MRKRDRLKCLTRKQIEKLIVRAKKTWVSMNETLKDGKWKDKDETDEE